MARLSLRERRAAYKITREAWLANNHDPEATKVAAEARVRSLALPPIVIELMVRIIVALIIEWMQSEREPAEMSVLLEEAEYEAEDDGF